MKRLFIRHRSAACRRLVPHAGHIGTVRAIHASCDSGLSDRFVHSPVGHDGVQPAAMRWFGEPVTEIKQILGIFVSCAWSVPAVRKFPRRGFGNALGIAAFTLSDGRRVTSKTGGMEPQTAPVSDVILLTCNHFSTVLAPDYNAAHYNHIHVDLMRRASGDRPCRPEAMTGEVGRRKRAPPLQPPAWARLHRGCPQENTR